MIYNETEQVFLIQNLRGMHMNKKKALDIALAQIEKQFGKGSIMKLGESAHMNISVIPQDHWNDFALVGNSPGAGN